MFIIPKNTYSVNRSIKNVDSCKTTYRELCISILTVDIYPDSRYIS